jgi:hypothetical protein
MHGEGNKKPVEPMETMAVYGTPTASALIHGRKRPCPATPSVGLSRSFMMGRIASVPTTRHASAPRSSRHRTPPRGGVYLELSPVFFTGAIATIQPQSYNAEFLLRMGLTDRFEFRLYSSGVGWQAAGLGMGETTGFAPLVFDTKMHLWERMRTGSSRLRASRPSCRRPGDRPPSRRARFRES